MRLGTRISLGLEEMRRTDGIDLKVDDVGKERLEMVSR
jgi:hypothetical protein